MVVIVLVTTLALPSVVSAATTLTVTTTADLSSCTTQNFSLRCAINQANKDGSGDTIAFHIPSTDPGCSPSGVIAVCTISITDAFNPLPTITASKTIINGYTQPSARPNTNPLRSGDNAVLTLSLDGGSSQNVFSGFSVSGIGDTIEGFSITDFTNGISTSGMGHVTIQGDFIGLEPDGSTQAGNSTGILDNGGGVTVGGTAHANSNVISGNGIDQVELGNGDIFQGNIVGLNAAGNMATDTIIPPDGILVGSNDLIGGTTSGSGNVISGNASGIRMAGSSSLIEGNLIGTDVTGMVAIGNEEGITSTASNSTIGGMVAAARNIISGNFNFGVDMGEGSGNVVEGNYIGTDITGEVALGNGGSNGATPQNSAGLLLSTTFQNVANNTIGGTTSAARNVISGNAFSGIQITVTDSRGGTGSTKNNLVEGNFIGLDATGTKALGNGTNGVFIASSQGFTGQIVNNTIRGNVIAHNGQSGILVGLSSSDTAVHTPMSQNTIFANGGLGIDLAPQGTVNCTTPPPGPNDFTPCPVINRASTTQVSGTAPANTTVEVFIASNELDDLGHGEGQTFLGSVVANASGQWSLSLPAGKLVHGQFVTATTTVTRTVAETSEFAANVIVQ